eukprot:scaffold4556_cov114-Isochrysis_galbana.AAC.7
MLLHRRSSEVEPRAVGPDDVPRARQLKGAVVDQLLREHGEEGKGRLGGRGEESRRSQLQNNSIVSAPPPGAG